MNVFIALDNELSDSEVSSLLEVVYVKDGYTDPEVAKGLFDPSKVKQRGQMISARESSSNKLIGMVIVVPNSSKSAFLSSENQCEIHLLGVIHDFRGCSLGKKLMEAAIDYAKEQKNKSIVLSTQLTMKSAHKLYEKLGFKRVNDRDYKIKDREFLVYQLDVS